MGAAAGTDAYGGLEGHNAPTADRGGATVHRPGFPAAAPFGPHKLRPGRPGPEDDLANKLRDPTTGTPGASTTATACSPWQSSTAGSPQAEEDADRRCYPAYPQQPPDGKPVGCAPLLPATSALPLPCGKGAAPAAFSRPARLPSLDPEPEPTPCNSMTSLFGRSEAGPRGSSSPHVPHLGVPKADSREGGWHTGGMEAQPSVRLPLSVRGEANLPGNGRLPLSARGMSGAIDVCSPRSEACASECSTSRWLGNRASSPRRAAIKQKLRAQRHLDEALREGCSSAVLRTALSRAVRAGCAEELLWPAVKQLALVEASEFTEEGCDAGDIQEWEGKRVPMSLVREREEAIVAELNLPPVPVAAVAFSSLPRYPSVARSRGRAVTTGCVPSAPTDGSNPFADEDDDCAQVQQPIRRSTMSAQAAAAIAAAAAAAAAAAEAEARAVAAALREREAALVEARRYAAQEALTEATNIESLEVALAAAKAANVAEDELARYEVDLWVAVAAKEALDAAIADGDTARIRAAAEAAKHVKFLTEYATQQEEQLLAALKRTSLRSRLEAALQCLCAASEAEAKASEAAVAASLHCEGTEAPSSSSTTPVATPRGWSGTPRGAAVAVATLRAAEAAAGLRRMVEDGRALGLAEEELEVYESAARRLERRQEARRLLMEAKREAQASNLQDATLEALMDLRCRFLSAVSDALEAGLPEAEVAVAERERQRVHNAVEDRRGAVRVFCRVRPLVAAEVAAGEQEVVSRQSLFHVKLEPAACRSAPWAIGNTLTLPSPSPTDAMGRTLSGTSGTSAATLPLPTSTSGAVTPGAPPPSLARAAALAVPSPGATTPAAPAPAPSPSTPGVPGAVLALAVPDKAGAAAAAGAAAGGVFAFDGVWAPGAQEEVFDSVRDLVQSAVDGFNVTVFAYGQTGAGKTFTMYGPASNSAARPPNRGNHSARRSDKDLGRAGSRDLANDPSGTDGLCPRAADEVFRIVKRNSSRFDFTVTLSMVELYRQHFIDLLEPGAQKSLKIRTLPSGEVFLENLWEQTVESPEDVHKLVRIGIRERHSRDTSMTQSSSRSHVLFCMKIASVNRTTGAKSVGKLLLVDLAGSERVKRSEVTGDGLREAIEINRSLSALGDVVAAIARGEKHVPYRNHELTQLLQDSLGGTAKTLMFVNLSPASCNREETAMSLMFAARAKGVVNRPARVVAAPLPI